MSHNSPPSDKLPPHVVQPKLEPSATSSGRMNSSGTRPRADSPNATTQPYVCHASVPHLESDSLADCGRFSRRSAVHRRKFENARQSR